MVVKRKRKGAPTLRDKLEEQDVNIFRALKAAKGFERQRQGKRVRAGATVPDKQARIEKEISMLKSLDLHQVAQVHLRLSLLKVKPIAALDDTAEELRAGIPKAEIAAEDKAAFNNITSALYNHNPVKQAVSAAVRAISKFLDISTDKKKPKTAKTAKSGDDVEEARKRSKARKEANDEDDAMVDLPESGADSEFEGFESDVDEPGPAVGEPDSEVEAKEEAELARLDNLLGSSDNDNEDDSSEDEGANKDIYSRFRGREKVNLDDISLSEGSESDAEDEVSDSSGSSKSASPPPAKKSKTSKTKKAAKMGPIKESTFLPSLMGGYISGSESASDIDVAPPKRRLGQRSRQAIAEKKFGARANHLRKERENGGRDAGWDMKRGAVEAGDQGRRGPWKRGITNPTAYGQGHPIQPKKEPKPTKRDDEGHLHPSWQAAKKAKEQKSASFSGQKIVFD